MKLRFDPKEGLIIVPTELHGPDGAGVLRLALDTGATTTLVNVGPLLRLGYNPALAPERVQVTTGSRVEVAPLVAVNKLAALGCTRLNFPVLGHTLPPSVAADGLLGLDFFLGSRLEIDFQNGWVQMVG